MKTENKILWVECGGSQTQGIFIQTYKTIKKFQISRPFHAIHSDLLELKDLTDELKKRINDACPHQILFFAAGIQESQKEYWKKILKSYWLHTPLIYAGSDLEALGMAFQRPAILAILGTGSSAAVWNGKNISEKTPSLGWILGDEGSGAWIGKQLLKYWLHGSMPEELKVSFHGFLSNSEPESIISGIYGREGKKYSASLALWLRENEVRRHVWIREFLQNGWNEFWTLNLKPLYQKSSSCPIVLCGGIAWNFRDQLNDFFSSKNIENLCFTPSATYVLEDKIKRYGPESSYFPVLENI